MFGETSDLYDLVYESIRDRSAEVAAIVSILQGRGLDAGKVLDVACGTGERARRLRTEHGFTVDGIDLDPGMVAQARAKNPEGHFAEADMADFDLGRRYGVVLSLFSSIGYVRTTERLNSAIRAMGRHVAEGGLLIVEPWFEPGTMDDGYVSHMTAEGGDRAVSRMSHTRVTDRASVITFEYLIGSADGLRRATEVHELGLFTREEMHRSFRAAGFDADYDPEGLMGRGLYVATRPEEPPISA